MKKILLAGLTTLALSVTLYACGSSSPSCTAKTCSDLGANCGAPADGCGGTLSCGTCSSGLACGSGSNNSIANVCGFAQPAGTVAVDFKVDDTTNKLYQNAQLDWKGSFADAGVRQFKFDSSWSNGNGPYPQMYDDGPWNKGGHEPIGSTAGDHIFGVTIFVAPPATGTDNYGFGLQDAYYRANWTTIAGAGESPDGWMWNPGPNGSFSVASTATGIINAGSITLRQGGTIDLQLVLDKNALATGTPAPTKIQVKSNAWYWGTVTLKDDGSTYGDVTAADGKFTFTLSSVIPAPFVHTAFLKSTDKIEFVFVLDGVEYKDTGGVAHTQGVTAGTRSGTSGAFTAASVTVASDNNTQIVVP